LAVEAGGEFAFVPSGVFIGPLDFLLESGDVVLLALERDTEFVRLADLSGFGVPLHSVGESAGGFAGRVQRPTLGG
jgi:hypothetical protein